MAKSDDSPGVDHFNGIAYSHEPAPDIDGLDDIPAPPCDFYRIETYTPYATEPFEWNVYFVPAAKLNGFFNGWEQIAEAVVDISRATSADRASHIEEYL